MVGGHCFEQVQAEIHSDTQLGRKAWGLVLGPPDVACITYRQYAVDVDPSFSEGPHGAGTLLWTSLRQNLQSTAWLQGMGACARPTRCSLHH